MFPRFQWQVAPNLSTAAALEHEPAVPIRRYWKTHLETIAIRIAVATGALVDDAVDLAMGRQRYTIRRHSTCRVELCGSDLGGDYRKIREIRKTDARRRRIRGGGRRKTWRRT